MSFLDYYPLPSEGPTGPMRGVFLHGGVTRLSTEKKVGGGVVNGNQ